MVPSRCGPTSNPLLLYALVVQLVLTLYCIENHIGITIVMVVVAIRGRGAICVKLRPTWRIGRSSCSNQ